MVVDSCFEPKLREFQQKEWISLEYKNGVCIINYNNVTGCFPLGGRTYLIVSPRGLNLEGPDDCLKLISLLLKYYGNTHQQGDFHLPTAKSENLKIAEIIPIECLAEQLVEQTSSIPDFPLRKIERINSTGANIKGKIAMNQLFKSICLKPSSRIISSHPKTHLNFAENRLIKSALDFISTHKMILDADLQTKLKFLLRQMSIIQPLSEPKNNCGTIETNITKLKLSVALSKSILTERTFVSIHDFLSINVPAVRMDYDLFEDIVSDAFQRILVGAHYGSISVSSQSTIKFEPDLVIPSERGKPTIVLDMKFKHLRAGEHGIQNRSDIYQIISHSLSLPDAHGLGLVYPRLDNHSPIKETIRLDKISPQKTIVAFWADLTSLFQYVTRHRNSIELERTILSYFRELESEALRVQNRISS